MKVLTVTNMWPYSRKIYYGIFVKEQVEALACQYPDIQNRVWFLRGYISKLTYIYSIFSLNWHLLFHTYDIIHIHSALSGVFLLFARKRKNVIITLHGTEVLDPSQYRVSKHVIRKAACLICVSDEIADVVRKSKVDAITCIVPCAVREYFFIDSREKKDDTFRIAFSSAKWRKVKNYPLFAEIISMLKARYGREFQTVEFDNKTREEILNDMNSIDLLLITSFHEGSPQIIKEAMCCNTPVVSSNVGTVKLMIDGLENCAVVNGYNAEDYVAAISEILFRNNAVFPIRCQGRQRIHDLRYDERAITSEVMQIYQSIAEKQI